MLQEAQQDKEMSFDLAFVHYNYLWAKQLKSPLDANTISFCNINQVSKWVQALLQDEKHGFLWEDLS